MLYHAGDSQHTQNIQINKVIGEKRKMCILFYGKNRTDFLANPILFPYKYTQTLFIYTLKLYLLTTAFF